MLREKQTIRTSQSFYIIVHWEHKTSKNNKTTLQSNADLCK